MERVGAERMSVATGPPGPLRPLRMIGAMGDLAQGNWRGRRWSRVLRQETVGTPGSRAAPAIWPFANRVARPHVLASVRIPLGRWISPSAPILGGLTLGDRHWRLDDSGRRRVEYGDIGLVQPGWNLIRMFGRSGGIAKSSARCMSTRSMDVGHCERAIRARDQYRNPNDQADQYRREQEGHQPPRDAPWPLDVVLARGFVALGEEHDRISMVGLDQLRVVAALVFTAEDRAAALLGPGAGNHGRSSLRGPCGPSRCYARNSAQGRSNRRERF